MLRTQKKHKTRRSSGLLIAGLLGVISSAYLPVAVADDQDVLNIVGGASVTRDSNLFRLSGSTNPLPITGSTSKSDTIYSAYVGLRIDKPYSLQRFQLDVTETVNRYDRFSYLNFNALEYRGAWLWQITPRLTGTISAEHREFLAPYDDFQAAQRRNVRDVDTRRFDFNWNMFGGWDLLGGISTEEQTSEVPFFAQADFKSTNYFAGARYRAKSGSSLTFQQYRREGDYLNSASNPVTVFDNSYAENESEFRAIWVATAKSTFDGRLAWLERRHDTFPQRDFSGVVGGLSYVWTPTAKLTFTFGARHDLRPYLDAFSSYRSDDTLTFSPRWAITEKTSLSMFFDRTSSDFRGPVFTPTGPLRHDTSYSVRLVGDWAATRNVLVSASIQRLERSSNVSIFEYGSNIFNLRAALRF